MVKIASVEAENVKRVKAVYLEPKPEGLTVIGGRNGQGKTSVLDAIAWALGGAKMRPTNARREGAASDPALRVVLDNGIVVERMPEVDGRAPTEGQIRNWVKADKNDWCPIVSEGGRGKPGILRDPEMEAAMTGW